MLVLSRKEGESIIIYDDIEVTATEIGRDRVVFSIEAPQKYRIRKGELPDEPFEGSGSFVPRNNPQGGLEGSVKLELPDYYI